MRTLLVISCIFLSNFVYAQTKGNELVDSIPTLKIDKKELINTSSHRISIQSQDSFPRKKIQETMYEGRKIRVVTEYTNP